MICGEVTASPLLHYNTDPFPNAMRLLKSVIGLVFASAGLIGAIYFVYYMVTR